MLLVVAVVYAVVVGATVRRYGGNVSSLIDVGATAKSVEPGGLGHGVVVFRNSDGYDGQAFYYVADDPFLQHRAYRDAFRYQRIGYPLAIWAASLGRRGWRPAAMLGVNLAAVLLVAYLSAQIIALYGEGASVWWALVCALNPGLLIGVQLDLAEPLALALALAGLLLYLRRKIGWAALLFALAMLTREVAVLFLAPILVAEVAARRIRSTVALALAVVPYLAWQAILLRAFGRAGAGTSQSDFGPPLAGVRAVLAAARPGPLRSALTHQGSVLAVVVLVGAALVVSAAYAVRRYDAVIGGILAHGVAAIFAGPAIWIAFNSAARVFCGIYPLTVFAASRHHNVVFRLLALGTALLSLITLYRIVAVTPTVPYYVTP